MSVEIKEGIRLHHVEEKDILEVRIPVRWHRLKGRKTLSVPGCLYRDKAEPSVKDALVHAHRCQRRLLNGEATSILALSKQEKVDKSQLSKVMRLTSLVPDIQKDILHGQGRWPLTLQQIMKPFPLEWHKQRSHFKALLECSG
ncbi:hypothetical protein M3P05_14230 [Sansalvadorimonas sp. 2012CJ34-2]|uniref:Uncharacterized protein n=1 Tax=Parendozoicomonas callyspongiae TaxID=2942213 RepID=A0ABT0PI82_9GAMM|nr:hypothetical protein [Sansalvadorimonas sp. 2012CJ34-2]MCL6271083.1 hypothetical protein [Sansalvadorimonas sp. 2012CJ34-2]